jgi:hypothetical protein
VHLATHPSLAPGLRISGYRPPLLHTSPWRGALAQDYVLHNSDIVAFTFESV